MAETPNTTTSEPRRVLMVVANPAVASTTGWPVGFWASELVHPWYEFTEAGYEVTIASPAGGRVEIDAFSDPRDDSRYSAHDILSRGFLETPELAELLHDTVRLGDVDPADFDAIVVCGGQSPMFTFADDEDLKRALREFYEAEKPTAALCHGVAALMNVTLSDGGHLIDGRTITGFSNGEEDEANAVVGQEIMPWRIEDAAAERGANYIQGGVWKAFAVRDGRLITGQQQYSGRRTAELVMEALGA